MIEVMSFEIPKLERVVLLKDEMQFFFIAIENLNSGEVKFSAPILGEKEGLRQFDLCTDRNIAMYS
jgi:hypothetical protein